MTLTIHSVQFIQFVIGRETFGFEIFVWIPGLDQTFPLAKIGVEEIIFWSVHSIGSRLIWFVLLSKLGIRELGDLEEM